MLACPLDSHLHLRSMGSPEAGTALSWQHLSPPAVSAQVQGSQCSHPAMSTDFPVFARTRVSLRWGGTITGQTNYATIIISKEEASRFFYKASNKQKLSVSSGRKKKKKRHQGVKKLVCQKASCVSSSNPTQEVPSMQ